ncbi:hypothetical protein D043_3606B, partial [Vibrio parahaemolyticus EKP-021]
TTTSLHTW